MPDRSGRRPNSSRTVEQFASIMTQIVEQAIFVTYDELKFKKPHDAGKRASCISDLAKKYHYDLSPRTLKKDLFQPWQANKTITLSDEYLDMFCEFLRDAAKDYHFEDRLHLVDQLYPKAQLLPNAAEKGPSQSPSASAADLPAVISWLAGTFWYVHERIGDDDLKPNGKIGIAVGEMSFKLKGNGLDATIISFYMKIRREYQGEVTFDQKSLYLYVKASLTGSGLTAMISLKLADFFPDYQTLMLGHFTYHAIKYDHLLTKTVVVQFKEADKPVIQLGDYLHGTEQYKLLDTDITNFLYRREKNRIGLPKKPVTDLPGLAEFVQEQIDKQNNAKLVQYIGHYHIYYKKLNGGLSWDELAISLNVEKRYYEGEYSHMLDVERHNIKKYLGKVSRNREVISLQLKEHIGGRPQEEDPILLSFHMPDERFNFQKCECLPGLLCGLQDSDRFPVSYACLLVRIQTDKSSSEGEPDPRIQAYFRGIKNYSMTTHSAGFRLDDLGAEENNR